MKNPQEDKKNHGEIGGGFTSEGRQRSDLHESHSILPSFFFSLFFSLFSPL